jgi:quinohemoprotein ethanol dehydrogenase
LTIERILKIENILKIFSYLSVLLLGVSNGLVASPVTDHRLRDSVNDSSNWLTHGRTYSEQRFSTLDSINQNTVDELGLSWYLETATVRGLQATPLVADGVMYFTAAWSVVYALDAKTGAILWMYDPKVPKEQSYKFCCGVVNRGVALWQNSVYVGTLDGRLVAIDAISGELRWQIQTTDPNKPYSITGAPRVVDGKVIIGNGGAEYGVRGFVTAYDAKTGDQVWRFYTVPGNPALGFENAQMQLAAKTWTGQWWQYGGGGTVWDAISFDPELNLLYIGVGNGSPHNQQIRSPGGGDNLFLSSIVALNPDTGDYVWHYQQVNGETWDYTATQQMVLADIEWRGEPRKVIMQAPKAGFFYLIDRLTGELLSAEPYVKVTWATGYDLKTGRAIENPQARYTDGARVMVFPTGAGGHNWHSMAYHPGTGLMYIPAMDFGGPFQSQEYYTHYERHWNLGYKTEGPPDNHLLTQALLRQVPQGFLLAWDPIEQREAWRVSYPLLGNGGVLATRGNLVFQGSADGFFHAYNATTGQRLWSTDVQNGVMAAPISYMIEGEQYVSVLVGRGGAVSMVLGVEHDRPVSKGRVLTFKLGSDLRLPEPADPAPIPEPPEKEPVAQDDVEQGRLLFNQFCSRCHGMNVVSDGSVPDLRYLSPMWHDNFYEVVRGGLLEGAGMPQFDDVLSEQQARWVHAYIIKRAHEDKALRETALWWLAVKRWFYKNIALILGWIS